MFAILVLCSLVFCLEICWEYGVLNCLQDLRPGLSLSDDDFFPGSAWFLNCGSKLLEQSCVVRFEPFLGYMFLFSYFACCIYSCFAWELAWAALMVFNGWLYLLMAILCLARIEARQLRGWTVLVLQIFWFLEHILRFYFWKCDATWLAWCSYVLFTFFMVWSS